MSLLTEGPCRKLLSSAGHDHAYDWLGVNICIVMAFIGLEAGPVALRASAPCPLDVCHL